jgi:hypothetical protein
MSSICKAICGLVAGATKARISAHFAVTGQLADVTAKESTQETAVTLLGLIIGLICASIIKDDYNTAWIIFISLLILHQYANYRLVRVLILDTLNPQKLYLILRHIEASRSSPGSNPDTKAIDIPSPEIVSKQESIFRPLTLSIRGPKLGASISVLFDCIGAMEHATSAGMNANDPGKVNTWDKLVKAWSGEDFVLGVDLYLRPIVCLKEGCSEKSMIKALMIGFYLQSLWLKEKNVALDSYFSIYMLFNAFNRSNRVNKLSYPQQKDYFDRIIATEASKSLNWYATYFDNIDSALGQYGWDTSSEKSRLGSGDV